MGHRGVDEFLTGSAQKKNSDAPKVTFADVAGQDNAKREVAELVEVLKKPDSYLKLGAKPGVGSGASAKRHQACHVSDRCSGPDGQGLKGKASSSETKV